MPHATRDAVKLVPFSTTGLSPSLVRFSAASSKFPSLLSLSHDPKFRRTWFRLFPFRSPLLGESLLLSFPWANKMFQFTQFPLPVLCVQTGVTPHYGCRVSPFGHPRIEAWSAAPRGFSQPPTSFIGSTCQGIHRWLFVTWKSTKMLVLAMQFSTVTAPKVLIEVRAAGDAP